MTMEKLRPCGVLTRGYFWLPCPWCGEEFGGNEWDGYTIPSGPHSGVGLYPECSRRLRDAGTISDAGERVAA